MNTSAPKVHVVDDDPAMRDALRFMFMGTPLPVETHPSAEDFLAKVQPGAAGCVILDLRMEGMSGLELHRQLRRRDPLVPVIVLTGHGDVSTAVEAMKHGAFDFLSKPVNRAVLLRRVEEALDTHARSRRQHRQMMEIRHRMATLSPREGEILDQVARGQSNKQIAHELHLSERTVANHRAHILAKTGAVNTADLVRLLAAAGQLQPVHGGGDAQM